MLVTTALAVVGGGPAVRVASHPEAGTPGVPGQQLIGPQRLHRRQRPGCPVARKEACPQPSPGSAFPQGILTAIALLRSSKALPHSAPVVHRLSGPHLAMSPLTSPPAMLHALPPPNQLRAVPCPPVGTG